MKNIAIIQVENEFHIIEILEHRDHIFTKIRDRTISVDSAEESAIILREEEGGVPANSMSSGNVAEYSPLLKAKNKLINRFRRKSPA